MWPLPSARVTKVNEADYTVPLSSLDGPHYYTFFKGKTWGYTPGGWNVARFDPASSGPHPYGVLPFVFVTHELPTTDLETKGLGRLLMKINRALNIDKSNLAHWVHHYARPLGFVSGVGPEWRPNFVDGGFVPLVVRHDSTEDAPVVPEADISNQASISEPLRSTSVARPTTLSRSWISRSRWRHNRMVAAEQWRNRALHLQRWMPI